MSDEAKKPRPSGRGAATQSPAQAAEGDVRAALRPFSYVGDMLPDDMADDEPVVRSEWGFILTAGDFRRASLSVEAAGTIAAARKQAAEEMRERAADLCESYSGHDAQNNKPTLNIANAAKNRLALKLASAIRALPLPPFSPEDQEKAKAAATPTIADPVKEGGR